MNVAHLYYINLKISKLSFPRGNFVSAICKMTKTGRLRVLKTSKNKLPNLKFLQLGKLLESKLIIKNMRLLFKYDKKMQ